VTRVLVTKLKRQLQIIIGCWATCVVRGLTMDLSAPSTGGAAARLLWGGGLLTVRRVVRYSLALLSVPARQCVSGCTHGNSTPTNL
jgi:hypothetical protein